MDEPRLEFSLLAAWLRAMRRANPNQTYSPEVIAKSLDGLFASVENTPVGSFIQLVDNGR